MKAQNIQIIFSDIDGTLLNKNRELSAVTVDTIGQITRTLNIPVVLVSARMPQGIRYLYNELLLNTPAICYNGALIVNSLPENQSQQPLFSTSIPYQSAMEIYELCSRNNLHFSLFSHTSWHANRYDFWTQREENNTRVKATISNDIPSLIEHLAAHNQPIHKLMVMGNASSIDIVSTVLNSARTNGITQYRSKETYLEISPSHADKASACLTLAEQLNIPLSNTLAFGDNFNDIEMIKSAGIGVAMGNAPEMVKKHAGMVAPSNSDNGVAVTLLKLFELQNG